jgi:hypothetical protein
MPVVSTSPEVLLSPSSVQDDQTLVPQFFAARSIACLQIFSRSAIICDLSVSHESFKAEYYPNVVSIHPENKLPRNL